MKRFLTVNTLILIAAGLLIVGCSDDKTIKTSQAVDSTGLPDTDVLGATIQLITRGAMTAEIKADRIVQFEEIDSTMAYGLDIDFFDSTGAISSHLVSDSGIINEKTGHLEVFGHVKVNTAQNTKLDTDHLIWDQKIDLVHTQAFVKIARPNDTLQGWGMEAPGDLSRFRILKQVSGSLTNPE